MALIHKINAFGIKQKIILEQFESVFNVFFPWAGIGGWGTDSKILLPIQSNSSKNALYELIEKKHKDLLSGNFKSDNVSGFNMKKIKHTFQLLTLIRQIY